MFIILHPDIWGIFITINKLLCIRLYRKQQGWSDKTESTSSVTALYKLKAYSYVQLAVIRACFALQDYKKC